MSLLLILCFKSNLSFALPITINFATTIYPPFVMQNSTQELEGFDIELAKALCKKLSAQCTFTIDKLDYMPFHLKNHIYDAWIGAITITNERKSELSFSDLYLRTEALLLAKNKPTTKNRTKFNSSPAEMRNRSIGIVENTCYKQYIHDTYAENIKTVYFTTHTLAIEALNRNELDAVIDDKYFIMHWIREQSNPHDYRVIPLPLKYSKFILQTYGIALNKENHELLKQLNKALKMAKGDGTIDMLHKKYLSKHSL